MRGAGIKSDMSDLSDKSDKMPVTALNKSYSPPSFFLQKESKQRKNTHYLYIFLQHCPMQITAPAAPLTVVARRAYPSPLNAARPSTDSLCSPTPGRLASGWCAARQFLAIAHSLKLVKRFRLCGADRAYRLRRYINQQPSLFMPCYSPTKIPKNVQTFLKRRQPLGFLSLRTALPPARHRPQSE